MDPDLTQPTRWSLVWRAGYGDTREMRLAREELARIYWQPVFHYIRRSGVSQDNAQDLTQGFFEHLIQQNLFASADRDRGRLRGYFFAVLRRYLINEWRRGRHREREVPLWEDEKALDSMSLAPDREFQRQWALATVHRALETTAAAYAATQRAELFEQLRPFLDGSADDRQYTLLAASTGKGEGALRTAVFRLRRDFRAQLSSLVARTLDHPTPEAVRDEIRDLLNCL